MSYTQTELEALLKDDEFVQWILHPGQADSARWESWIREQADRPALVDRCRRIVTDVRAAETDQRAKALAGEIWLDVEAAMQPRLRWPRFAAAAAVALLLAGAGWWWMGEKPAKTEESAQTASSVARTESGEVLVSNTGEDLKSVLMVDGSRITLSPGARVRFQSLPGPDARNVQLEGTAFFEVTADPKRPFTVYAGKVVTRVLGTSFRISGDRSITVAVRSGKVAVSHDGNKESWILLPNEQATYDAGRNTMARSVVIHKEILDNPALPVPRFSFDETPAPAVVDDLAATYAVNIRYDRRLFENAGLPCLWKKAPFMINWTCSAKYWAPPTK